jgi:hypothetical protein
MNLDKDGEIAEYTQIITNMEAQREKDSQTIKDIMEASNIVNV